MTFTQVFSWGGCHYFMKDNSAKVMVKKIKHCWDFWLESPAAFEAAILCPFSEDPSFLPTLPPSLLPSPEPSNICSCFFFAKEIAFIILEINTVKRWR